MINARSRYLVARPRVSKPQRVVLNYKTGERLSIAQWRKVKQAKSLAGLVCKSITANDYYIRPNQPSARKLLNGK